MSINIKKYTKDQMAKMVEEAQEGVKTAAAYEATWRNQAKNLQSQVSDLKAKNAALTERLDQMNGEAINKENEIANLKADADALRNKLADAGAALGRTNAELSRSVIENKQLWSMNVKVMDRAAVECERANYAESHPWRNLWKWIEKQLKMA